MGSGASRHVSAASGASETPVATPKLLMLLNAAGLVGADKPFSDAFLRGCQAASAAPKNKRKSSAVVTPGAPNACSPMNLSRRAFNLLFLQGGASGCSAMDALLDAATAENDNDGNAPGSMTYEQFVGVCVAVAFATRRELVQLAFRAIGGAQRGAVTAVELRRLLGELHSHRATTTDVASFVRCLDNELARRLPSPRTGVRAGRRRPNTASNGAGPGMAAAVGEVEMRSIDRRQPQLLQPLVDMQHKLMDATLGQRRWRKARSALLQRSAQGNVQGLGMRGSDGATPTKTAAKVAAAALRGSGASCLSELVASLRQTQTASSCSADADAASLHESFCALAELLCASKPAAKTTRGRSPRRRRSLDSSVPEHKMVPAPRPSRSPDISTKTRPQSRAEAALAAAASSAAALALELKQERAAKALLLSAGRSPAAASAPDPAVDHDLETLKAGNKDDVTDEQQRSQAEAASERRLSQTLPAPQLKSLLSTVRHGTPRAQTPGRKAKSVKWGCDEVFLITPTKERERQYQLMNRMKARGRAAVRSVISGNAAQLATKASTNQCECCN